MFIKGRKFKALFKRNFMNLKRVNCLTSLVIHGTDIQAFWDKKPCHVSVFLPIFNDSLKATCLRGTTKKTHHKMNTSYD